MVSVVVVIINIIFIIIPNPREYDHTFPGILEGAGMGHVVGERGSHLQLPSLHQIYDNLPHGSSL